MRPQGRLDGGLRGDLCAVQNEQYSEQRVGQMLCQAAWILAFVVLELS